MKVLWLCLALAAAGSLVEPASRADASDTRMIVDSLGRHVVVPAHPRRVISLNSDLTESIYALGAADRLVAPGYRVTKRQAWLSKHAPRLVHLASPQSPAGVNVEQVAALRPDLIVSTLFGEVSADDVIKTLGKLRVPIVILSFERLASYDHDLLTLGRALGADTRAKVLARYLDSTLASVRARTASIPSTKRARVYQALTDAYHSVGRGIFEDDQIRAAGGVNVGTALKGFGAAVSPEQLLIWQPDVIVMLAEGSLRAVYADSKLAGLNAVRRRRVYRQPEQGWGFGTPRAIFEVTWLARKLYPERFRDVNLMKLAESFYKRVYGFGYSGPQLG